MLYLRKYCEGLERIDLGDYRFYFLPGMGEAQASVAGYLAGERTLQSLDLAEDTRAVYLLPGRRSVFKFNKLRHWRLRLKKHLGISASAGNYCLTNEFMNLRRLSHSALAPTLHGYGHNRRGFLKEEFLLVEFLDNAPTLDERLTAAPDEAPVLLEQVLALFKRMLAEGFVHMDPHPKNILVTQEGLRLIDFECCSFDVSERAFALAFATGYFFHFWFHRFMGEEAYDAQVLRWLQLHEQAVLSEDFFRIYQRFKIRKVSRKQRYAFLTSRPFRKSFVQHCKSEGVDIEPLKSLAQALNKH